MEPEHQGHAPAEIHAKAVVTDSVKAVAKVDEFHSASAKMAAHRWTFAILLSLQHVNNLLLSQRSHNRHQGLSVQETVRVMGKSRQLLGSFWLPGVGFCIS